MQREGQGWLPSHLFDKKRQISPDVSFAMGVEGTGQNGHMPAPKSVTGRGEEVAMIILAEQSLELGEGLIFPEHLRLHI
jgi:hypothetical protein